MAAKKKRPKKKRPVVARAAKPKLAAKKKAPKKKAPKKNKRPVVARVAKPNRGKHFATRGSGQQRTLDWDELARQENGAAFERLGLDLFELVHGTESFIPNAERSGPDGGSDGIFNAPINRVPGPWKVACAVRKKFADVKKKVIDENHKARAAGQSALFFITSFDLTASQTDEVERLARKGLKGARVWSRRRMTNLLREYSWLRQLYFGHELIPGFVPVVHWTELDDQSQPDLELYGREHELEAIRKHLAGDGRIVVIKAAGGAGKSRLLRALPGKTGRRSVWLRRPGLGRIEDAYKAGLPKQLPTLLVLDDAGQSLGELSELAKLALAGR